MIDTLPPGRWVSLEKAAASISVSRATIYRLLDRGHVVAVKVGTRRLVDLDSLDRHLDELRLRLAELGKGGGSGLPPTPACPDHGVMDHPSGSGITPATASHREPMETPRNEP